MKTITLTKKEIGQIRKNDYFPIRVNLRPGQNAIHTTQAWDFVEHVDKLGGRQLHAVTDESLRLKLKRFWESIVLH